MHEGINWTERKSAVPFTGHQDDNTPSWMIKFGPQHPHTHSFALKKPQGHITPREAAIYI